MLKTIAYLLQLSVSLISYPKFKQDNYVEDFHGTKLPDPFRWLEDPDSDDTKDFVEKQNDIFYAYRDTLTHSSVENVVPVCRDHTVSMPRKSYAPRLVVYHFLHCPIEMT